MDIVPSQHWQQLLLAPIFEAARPGEFARVLVSAKQHVPPDDVAIVVAVATELMVDAVHFRALKHVSNPMRTAHVGMIEEFAQGSASGVDRARAR
jgi:hypothetical protein